MTLILSIWTVALVLMALLYWALVKGWAINVYCALCVVVATVARPFRWLVKKVRVRREGVDERYWGYYQDNPEDIY
jgi:hypothetical protein